MLRPFGPTRVPRILAVVVSMVCVFSSTPAMVFAEAEAIDSGPVSANKDAEVPESVVFATDPSQALVIDRAAGLLPLISAASDVLPLTVNALEVAEARLYKATNLLSWARTRHRVAVEVFAVANRLIADNVRDAAVLRSGYGDALDGISEEQRRRLERESRTRKNRSAVTRQATSKHWVCPVPGRTKFRDSWHELRSGNRLHEGVDLVGFRNDPVVAPVDGLVSHRWDTIGGWSFDLVTPGGDYYFGTHMSGLGQSGEVEAGDVIGFLGDTGNAQGVHLHFEYHPGGRENSVNPYPIVDAQCVNRVEMGLSLYE